MGVWSRTKKRAVRAAKKTGTAIKSASGEIARSSAVAGAALGAGAVCAIPPLTPAAPFCAAAAAIATDKLVGDKIERVTRRAIDRGGQEADDFIKSLRGGSGGGDPPPGMLRTVTGTPTARTSTGRLMASTSPVKGMSLRTYLLAAAVTLALLTLTLLALRRAGRI